MATKKETMIVISGGVADVQSQELNNSDLAVEIAMELARKTAKRFKKMVAELDEESIRVIVKAIEHIEPEAVEKQFECLFSLAEMEEARDDMEFLFICAQYNEHTFEVFKDEFLEDEYVDDYSVENLIEEETQEKDANLN